MSGGSIPRIPRSGRVLDAQGRPVGGAIVVVVSGTAPTPEVGIRTHVDGSFVVALPAGRFRLQAKTRTDSGSVELDCDHDGEIIIRLQGSNP